MELKEWMRSYKPVMIVLLEPKISGAEASEVCKKIGKTHLVLQKGLIDLRFTGQKFTWIHGGSVDTTWSACLDRGLCDDQWRRLFPEATIKHLCHSYSDHCLLLLSMDPKKERCLGERPFRF